MELWSKQQISPLAVGLTVSDVPAGNPCGEEYLKCNCQSWKLASKHNPPNGNANPNLTANSRFKNIYIKNNKWKV